MTQMIIKCGDWDEFCNAIYGCVKRGLTFEAKTVNLTITLTGGY